MKEIIINIMPYKGKPFAQPIDLWVFEAKKEIDWYQIGWNLRQIRMRLSNTKHLAFQVGNKIISTINLKEKEELIDLLTNFEVPLKETFRTKEEKDIEVLRKLLGEAISHQLRNDMRHAYKIIEQPNAVYYASEPSDISGFGEIEVYKGFTFVPLIQDNGQASVMIDPRAKYHSKKTLRELLSDEDKESWLKELEIEHIDEICHISWCEEKKNPLSPCKLSGPGKPISIIDFLDEYPSEVRNTNKDGILDLIKYHSQTNVCLRGYLKNHLRNKPPVALSDFGYIYPLERIRRSPKTYLIENQTDRRKLHSIVSLDSGRRYSRTLGFARLIQNLFIDHFLEIESNGELFSNVKSDDFSLQSGQLPWKKVLLGNENESFYPNKDITLYGPYRQPENITEIHIILIIVGKHKRLSEFKEKIKNVLSGTTNSPELNEISLASILKKPVKIKDSIEIGTIDEIKSLKLILEKNKVENEKKHLFLMSIGEQTHGLIPLIKKQLVTLDFPNQGVNISSFLEKFEKEQKSYFFNIILGAFCKLQGVPWAVKPINESTIFLGYSSRIRKEKIVYAISIYDSFGIWNKGFVTITDSLSFNKKLEEDLDRILSEIDEKDIRFYSSGSLYQLAEYEIILRKLNETTKDFKIIEIIHNPLRIYTISDRGAFSAKRGSYVEFLSKNIALVTTIPPGKQGTPQPILIKFKNDNRSKLKTYIEEIFSLTYYAGYGRMIIRYPTPIHAAKSLMQQAISLDIEECFEFNIPWFV